MAGTNVIVKGGLFYPADASGNAIPDSKGYASRQLCMDSEGIAGLRPLHTIGRAPEHTEAQVTRVVTAAAEADAAAPVEADSPDEADVVTQENSSN